MGGHKRSLRLKNIEIKKNNKIKNIFMLYIFIKNLTKLMLPLVTGEKCLSLIL